MSRRKVNFAKGEYYHIYNRGNSKQKIFFDEQDYERFCKLLYLCNSERNINLKDISQEAYDFDRIDTLVYIGAFCLMPNHFHILVREKEEGGITKFMQKLSTAYAMYINTKYKRTGSLFEGKFKAQHLNTDRYLKYTFSYIHLNPVKLIDKNWREDGIKDKIKTKKYLLDYKYSSYMEYIGENRPQSKTLSREMFPDYFSTKKFESEILDWIYFTPEARPQG